MSTQHSLSMSASRASLAPAAQPAPAAPAAQSAPIAPAASAHAGLAVSSNADSDSYAQLVLRIGYRGGDFSGWAFQPGVRSVEGELTRALETFLRRPCALVCAGRTDAGVHAHAQYVSLGISEAEAALSREKIMRALSALTPDDISIRSIYRADPSFSARFSATSRSYCYRIALGSIKPVLTAGYVWHASHIPHVCMDDMNEAAQALLGEHDFTSFCKKVSAERLKEDGLSLSRRLTKLCVARDYVLGEQILRIDIEGNAFLHNMVRIIVGSLMEVGRGQRDTRWLSEVLEARARERAAMTAPAKGLVLEQVTYPAFSLSPWE